MKRKMVIIGICYVLGLFFASFFVQLWMRIIVLLVGAGSIVLAMIHPKKRIAILTGIISCMTGALLYGLYTLHVVQPILDFSGIETTFSGNVVSEAVYANELTSYTLNGQFSDGTKAKIAVLTDNLGCRYGDIIEVSGTFSEPENDFLYDSVRYNKGHSIFLQADAGCTYRVTLTDGHTLMRRIAEIREAFSRKLYFVGGRMGGSLTAAMLLGDDGGLDAEIERAFYHAGIGPMLSVSGFHLVLVTSLAGIFGRRNRLQRIVQFFLTVVITVVFALLAQMPVSVLRAGIMLLLTRSACIFFRKADPLTSLCIAVVLMTASEPYLIYDVGFQLSVVGTFGVSTFAPYMTRPIEPVHLHGVLGKMLLSGMLVTVCTLPICIFSFTETSLMAPITNIIYTPLCILLMLSGMVLFLFSGIPGVSVLCGFVMDSVGSMLTSSLLWMQEHVSSTLPLGLHTLPKIAAVLTVMVFLGFLVRRNCSVVYAFLGFSMIMLTVAQSVGTSQREKLLRMYVLGQDAQQLVVVTFGGRTDVIDLTGDYKNPTYLRVFLEKNGISRIDMLYLCENAASLQTAYDSALSGGTVMSAAADTQCSVGEICGAPVQKASALRLTCDMYTLYAEDGQLSFAAGDSRIFIEKSSVLTIREEYDYIITANGKEREKYLWTAQSAVTGTMLCIGDYMEIAFSENGEIMIGG